MMKLLALLSFLLPFSASAMQASSNAFRIEDKKEGNLVIGADQARIERGELYHTVVVLWGKLDIYGEVDEVVVLAGHVVFHEGSALHKSLVVMGGSFESQPGSGVKAENIVTQAPGPLWRAARSAANFWRENISWMARVLASLVSCVILWLSAWLLFAAFPGLVARLEPGLVQKWPKHLLLGFFGSMGACALTVLLVLSILGIFLLPLYFLMLFVCAWISYSVAALWAGHRMLPPKQGKILNPWGLLLGCIAFQFLWNVPVWGSSLPVIFLWTVAWGKTIWCPTPLVRGER